MLGAALAHREVNFAITHPGMRGEAVAFVSELFIAFLLMTVILNVSNSRKFARYTGLAAGTMVMLFITFEAPISGMSMNPARSFASDFVGMQWQGLWIYFVAPVIGMLTAAEVFVRTRGIHSVICAKLNHSGTARCIFRCGYMMPARAPAIEFSGSGITLNHTVNRAGLRAEERIAVSNDNRYDVIIIGTGAGGGTLAYHLRPRASASSSWSVATTYPRNGELGPQGGQCRRRRQHHETWLDKDGNDLHPHTNYNVAATPSSTGRRCFAARA